MIRLYHGSNVKIEVPIRQNTDESMTAKLTPEQKQLLKDDLCAEIAGFLVDDYKYSPEGAIDVLYIRDFRPSARRQHRIVLSKSGICVFISSERIEYRKGCIMISSVPI